MEVMRVVDPGNKGGDWTSCHTTSSSFFHLSRVHCQQPHPTVISQSSAVLSHIKAHWSYSILQKLMLNLEKPTEIPVCGLGNPLFSYMWASKFLRGLHTCIVVFAKWLVFLCVHFYSGLKNCLPRLWFPIFYMFVILKCVRSNQCTY